MALRLTLLDDTNREAFEALLARAWEQNWGSELARALIRWRYYDRPSGGGTWLALNDGQCVAMLDSFVRPYLLDGRRILVRAGCDWYCLPKYRAVGLGLRLMRRMMDYPEPMLAIGGSDSTRDILPRLGWTRLPDAQRYILPLKARSLAGALLRHWRPRNEGRARAIPGFVPLLAPRRTPSPRGGVGRIAEWRPGSLALLPLPKQQGLVQLLEQADQDWIGRMPAGVAQPLALAFFMDESLVGFSLSQIEPTATGFEGRIVHLQLAEQWQAVADWVVGETVQRLSALGAGIIRCWASQPTKDLALRKAGFVALGPLPSYWWSKNGVPAPSVVDAGYLRADDAIPFAALRGRHLAAPGGVVVRPQTYRPGTEPGAAGAE